MLGKRRPQVLVVGAGPVGLFAALALVNRDIRVRVIDRDWRTGAHSYALALHPASLRLLGQVGLLRPVLERAYRVRTIGLYEGNDHRAELRMPDAADGLGMVAVLRQDVLEQLMEEALSEQGVKVEWNHELSALQPRDTEAVATVDKLVKESVGYAVAHTEWVVARSETLAAPFVIGADGHLSSVRRMLGIEFAEAAPSQHFAVFEFRSPMDLDGQMRIVLGEASTDALWPLPGGFCRWGFELAEHAASESGGAPKPGRMKDRIRVPLGPSQFPVVAEERLKELLAQRAPWFAGDLGQLQWHVAVRFERRLAARFGRGRVWLAGDAGHMTGPVGMQSMNVGLREAHDLARIIAGILREGCPADELEQYDRQRVAEWRALLGLEGGLVAGQQAAPWIRDRAARLLPCLPASGNELRELAGQLGLELAEPRPAAK